MWARLWWLASSGVNFDDSNCNFSPGYVNQGIACAGGDDLFNSNGNENENWFAVRHVDSINCGYASKLV